MMSNVFEDTMGTIGDLIADNFRGVISNLKDITDENGNPVPAVVDESSIPTSPDYPYITMGIVDDFIPQSQANWTYYFSVEIQFKVIGDDRMNVLGINRELYKWLWDYETMSKLNDKGISTQSVSELPNTVDAFANYNQYSSGWSIKFMINEDFTASRDANKTPTNSDIYLRKDE